jgi:hypothetical protein
MTANGDAFFKPSAVIEFLLAENDVYKRLKAVDGDCTVKSKAVVCGVKRVKKLGQARGNRTGFYRQGNYAHVCGRCKAIGCNFVRTLKTNRPILL